jgi:hypothetical protein
VAAAFANTSLTDTSPTSPSNALTPISLSHDTFGSSSSNTKVLDSRSSKQPQLALAKSETTGSVIRPDEFADRMRTAAIMLAQLTQSSPLSPSVTSPLASPRNPNIPATVIPPPMQKVIRERIIKEMIALEEKRLARVTMAGPEDFEVSEDVTMLNEDALAGIAMAKEDPSGMLSWITT